nr:diguanylate cyclase [Propionibacteriales bacterium]
EVFSASPLGMALLDSAGVVVVGNEALSRFFDRASADVAGHRLSDFRHPDDTRRESDSHEPAAVDASPDAERFLRADGSVVYAEVTRTLLRGGRHTVVQLRDVTVQREAVSRLAYLATHDAATGVGNRVLLLQELDRAISAEPWERAKIALLFIDLDGFKRINDNFSHAVGDQVLRTVAQRLLTVVRPRDWVVRWGGDEFIVMLHPLAEERVALDLAERIGAALSAPVDVGDDRASVTSSIGVAYSNPGDGLDIDDLLRNADTAMYHAKREQRSSFSVFGSDLAD